MSTIYSAVDKLRALITENHVEPKVEEVVKEVISLLTDPTVLLLEWNEEDVQTVARSKLAQLFDVEEEDLVEKPLSKDNVEYVISRLDKYHDCNYGITWDSVDDALDDVVLPSLEEVLNVGTIEEELWNVFSEARVP